MATTNVFPFLGSETKGGKERVKRRTRLFSAYLLVCLFLSEEQDAKCEMSAHDCGVPKANWEDCVSTFQCLLLFTQQWLF